MILIILILKTLTCPYSFLAKVIFCLELVSMCGLLVVGKLSIVDFNISRFAYTPKRNFSRKRPFLLISARVPNDLVVLYSVVVLYCVVVLYRAVVLYRVVVLYSVVSYRVFCVL